MACVIDGVRCGTVNIAGLGEMRYGIFPGNAKAGLILVEIGGPGLNALGRSSRDTLGLPPELAPYDVLLINEPWTGQPQHPQCADGLNQFAQTISSVQTDSRAKLGGCTPAIWSAATYKATLQAVLQKENTTLTGIVGHSFGALAAAAAADLTPDAWLILSSPVAPPSTGGQQMLAERTTSLRNALNRSYAANCSPQGLDCSATGYQAVLDAIKRMPSRTATGRSTSVTAGDLAVAVMGASYSLANNEQWLWQTIAAVPNLNNETLIQIGRMADQVLMRHGTNEISLNLAAYVLGICSTYTGWFTEPAVDVGPVPESLLGNVANECQQGNRVTNPWIFQDIGSRPGAVCVFSNTLDPVTPGIWAEQWKPIAPRLNLTTFSYSGHASLDTATRSAGRTSCQAVSKG